MAAGHAPALLLVSTRARSAVPAGGGHRTGAGPSQSPRRVSFPVLDAPPHPPPGAPAVLRAAPAEPRRASILPGARRDGPDSRRVPGPVALASREVPHSLS